MCQSDYAFCQIILLGTCNCYIIKLDTRSVEQVPVPLPLYLLRIYNARYS